MAERSRLREGGVIGNALPLPQREGYWFCRSCRNQFNVMHGTPMEGTYLPPLTWFAAIFLSAMSSNGVSPMALSRQLDLGYKSAWFLAHRIRSLMPLDRDALKGFVAMDEAYLGRRRRRKGATSEPDADDDEPKRRSGKAKAKPGQTRAERTIADCIYRSAARSSVLLRDDPPGCRRGGAIGDAERRV